MKILTVLSVEKFSISCFGKDARYKYSHSLHLDCTGSIGNQRVPEYEVYIVGSFYSVVLHVKINLETANILTAMKGSE